MVDLKKKRIFLKQELSLSSGWSLQWDNYFNFFVTILVYLEEINYNIHVNFIINETNNMFEGDKNGTKKKKTRS